MASETAVRSRAMTERGSALPITALPDTIMLAPACGAAPCGEPNAHVRFTAKHNHGGIVTMGTVGIKGEILYQQVRD